MKKGYLISKAIEEHLELKRRILNQMLIPTIEPKTVQYFCRTLQYRDDLAMASALLEFEVEKKAKVIGYKKIHREDGTPIDMAIYEAA